LYNANKDYYELLNTLEDGNTFSIDHSGKHLITQKKLVQDTTNWVLIGGIAAAIFLGVGVAYIVVKKKHWFW
jgi:hypothetical protein